MFNSEKLTTAIWTLRSVLVVLAFLLSASGDSAIAGFDMPSASSNSSVPSSSAASQPTNNLGAQQSLLQLSSTQSQNLKCIFLGISVTLIIVILSSIIRARGSLQLQLVSGGQNDSNGSHSGPSANLHQQGNASGQTPQYVHQIPIGLPMGYLQPMPVAMPMQIDPRFVPSYNVCGQPGFGAGPQPTEVPQPTEASQPVNVDAAEKNRHSEDESAVHQSGSQLAAEPSEDRKSFAEGCLPISQDRSLDSVTEESEQESTSRHEVSDAMMKSQVESQDLNNPLAPDSDGTLDETNRASDSRSEIEAASAAHDADFSGESRKTNIVRMHGSDQGQGTRKTTPKEERDQDDTQDGADAIFNEIVSVTLRTQNLKQGTKRSMTRY